MPAVEDQLVQGRLLWCDAEANAHRMGTREDVADIVDRASRANINTLIVDVKPLGGEVLYSSKYAPKLVEVEGKAYPQDFDLLAAMIEEGHAKGVKIHAAMNVFSEGHREWGRGPAYQHPEWQVTMYEALRHVEFAGGPSFTIELMDPWDRSDKAVIYTRRAGQTRKCDSGKRCVIISDDAVTSVVDVTDIDIDVPSNGCILSLPASDAESIRVGEKVLFSAEPVFRSAVDSKVSSFGIFVNPIGPVKAHELQIIEEIVSNYDIDGIVFDRMRYPNLYADFGDASRASFEAWLGRGPVEWPYDVFAMNDLPWKTITPGKYYKQWIEWRAWQIRNFAEEASTLVRSIKPEVIVGTYVGSWYDSYYDVSVNWGSSRFHAGCDWMTPEYNRTGYAEFFDYICTGCYYPILTRADARAAGRPEGATVEAACELSLRAINGECPVYGSLYLRDYQGSPDGFGKAIDIINRNSAGIMLFDLVYLYDYGWWPIAENAFPSAAVSPHDVRE